jgi:tetratricopeptide (TPR) repeat protein
MGVISSPENRIRQGEALLAQGHRQAALDTAEAVLLEMPQWPAALLLRGAACKALQRYADAADSYRAVLLQFPDFHAMRLNVAHALIELGQLEEAEAVLRETITRGPDFAAAHASLGSLYMRLDRYDLAEAPTRQALTLDPAIIPARQNLAAILDLRDDPEAIIHRDAAYRRQQIFVESAPGAELTALIVTASGRGNLPYTYLLPRSRFNRILWHVAYAPPGQAQALPPHDFIINAVGDPDAAPEALRAAEAFAASCAHPVINSPRAIARTGRANMPELLAGIPGLMVPRTMRLRPVTGDTAKDIAGSRLRFPIILRPAGRHGGEGANLIRSESGLAGLPGLGDDLYATEFANYRSADGWYRKYRMIFVDREPFPYHLAIGSRWLLHYTTSAMENDESRREEEADFLRDPVGALGQGAMAAIRMVASRLDLDFAGMDFSQLPDGQILFFEANATMLVHPEEEARFAYKNAAVTAIIDAVEAMIARRLGR